MKRRTPAASAYTRAASVPGDVGGLGGHRGCAIDESTSLEQPNRRAALTVRVEARLPADPVRRRRRGVGRRRSRDDVHALRHADRPGERGRCRRDGRGRGRAPGRRRTGARPLPPPLPLRQLRRGAGARLQHRHRRARDVHPRPVLRRLARPSLGARARGVPRARAGGGVPLRRPARRGPSSPSSPRPDRAARRVRGGSRRRPDHAHAAAQPRQPVPTGRPRRRRSPPGPDAAQRAAGARHGCRGPRRRHSPWRHLGARGDPPDHRRAAARVRRAAARGRRAGARVAARRAAAGGRAPVGHPPDHGRRSPRPAPRRRRHDRDRRLHHRTAGARHGRRRLDRVRAVPPAARLPSGLARDARSRRVRPPRHPAEPRGSRPPRLAVARARRHPRSDARVRGVPGASPGGGVPRRRAQAPPAARVQSIRGVEDERRRHPQRPRGRRGIRRLDGSSTSAATRPPIRRTCSGSPSASASG